MLVSSRIREGPSTRRGCIALYRSKDLKNWKLDKPFFKPNLYYILEVPDLFTIGEWSYLLFSENNGLLTHYRMSKSLYGPWMSPADDTFDTTSYYAAKTASDGNKRYLFGWVPRKTGKNDYNNWEWGGNLLIHEIFQNNDGTLSVKAPNTIDNYFSKEINSTLVQVTGNWEIKKSQISANSAEGFSFAISEEKMPPCCKISTNIRFERSVKDLGIMIRVSDDYENAYYIKLEPKKNRIVFDMIPKKTLYPRDKNTFITDHSFIPGHERFIELRPGKNYNLKVFIEDNVCVTYLDNKVALTSRIYNLKNGRWGLFLNEGKASFYKSTIQI